ncbi:MAG: TIM barrel protein [Planctomycetaceae bacterium]|nr:TIM barrel protein [Planctomycetaceae bacterium]
MKPWSIGVFTSIDAGLGVPLHVAKELGVDTIQIHAPKPTSRTPLHVSKLLAQLSDTGIEATAVFGGFEGESYADIPTTAATVGLVPVGPRAERLEEMKRISDYARAIDCSVVALHLGYVPHDTSSADYQDVVHVTRDLCRYAANHGQNLHLETGQETAPNLVQFISDVGTKNLFVNFDPANMILYGQGDPIEALQILGSLVRSVHCKDAKWSPQPGITWGQEVPLGAGDVGMERYLTTLQAIGYDGPLTIEREIPQEPDRQKSEIGHAVELLNKLRQKLLGY